MLQSSIASELTVEPLPAGWLTIDTVDTYLAGAWLASYSTVRRAMIDAATELGLAKSPRHAIKRDTRVFYSPHAQRLLLNHAGTALALGKDWPRMAAEAIERALARKVVNS